MKQAKFNYRCRTPEEWLSLGVIDGKQYPIPAEALIEISEEKLKKMEKSTTKKNDKNALFGWQLVAVFSYTENFGTRHWKVMTLDGEKRTYILPRLYFRFLAEDPRIFTQRIVAAISERARTVTSLK